MTTVILDNPMPAVILDSPPPTVVTDQPRPVVILDNTGAIGPQGPPGDAGGLTVTYDAQVPLSGHFAVKIVAGSDVNYPDNTVPTDGDLIIGITTGAASQGAPATVQVAGTITEPSWNWALGGVYVAQGGALTQNPPQAPTAAWIKQIGIALAPTVLLVQLRPSIITA
jgi:hypothetical protein